MLKIVIYIYRYVYIHDIFSFVALSRFSPVPPLPNWFPSPGLVSQNLDLPKPRRGGPKPVLGVPTRRFGDPKPRRWVPKPRLGVPAPRLEDPK